MDLDISTSNPVATLVPTMDGVNFDSHAHSVQFYGDDVFLLEEMSRFIGSALGAGDAAIVIATKAHRDGLAQRLMERGLDIDLTITQGRYVALDAAETLAQFMVDGRPDAARFNELIGSVIELSATMAQGEHPRVAAFGEMVALLWAEGKPEAAIELEQLWNDLARTHSFDLLCAYPMNFFSQSGDGELFGRVCGAHSHVIPAEDYISLTDEGERLRAITILQQKAQALENEIEERRKAQQALHEKNDELREAVATRDEFLSVAAHELKTPVTSLRGFAQLLLRDTRRKRDIPAERLEFALDAIELQTAKLSQLVARLLDTAQIEAGKLRIEPVRTDLVGLVHSALAQQQGGANYTFVFDGPKHLEALVDPVRFEQALTNLLDNAVKFSPQGGTVTVQLRHGDDGSIRLSVTDHGIGIPNGEREHIFGRFHQAHDERHLSGMGLGLFITREIVQLHGGFIGIEEPEDGGSRFVITLPYSNSNAQTGPLA
jgi:signal transduction histidine kinase